MSSSTSSNDASKSAYRQGEDISSIKKVSTSCAQKVESCNNDRASNNTRSNSSSDIDVSDNLGRADISNNGIGKMAISDDDDKLFQDPPPKEDCPICMLPMPHASGICGVQRVYMPCCGKTLCKGCSNAEDEEIIKGNIKPWCACCRVPLPRSSDEELLKRFKKRMKLNEAEAFYQLGMQYQHGTLSLPKNKALDLNKAFKLLNQAAKLGSCRAHCNLGDVYQSGQRVEKNMKKAMYHWKIAAIGGHERARFNLGIFEARQGNMDTMDKVMKHLIIAAKSGLDDSLKAVGEGYKAGLVTKDEYAATLRAQVSVDEMKSNERTKAAGLR